MSSPDLPHPAPLAATVRALLQDATQRLASTSPSPRIDADCLLQQALQKDRSWLRLHETEAVDASDSARFEAMLRRRERGEPVAYITGMRGFWSLDLEVGPATLIPRADTEVLVEWALELLAPESTARGPGLLAPDAGARVLDLGTGSGAIALALKKERPACAVMALDASKDALAVARGNGARLGLAVEFVESDWWAALAGRRFDLVVANPPYIAEGDPHLVAGDLRFEPTGALVAAEAGLRDLRRIIDGAPAHLAPGGWLLLEHGYEQGEAVRALLRAQGFADVATRRDLGGQERISGGRWPC